MLFRSGLGETECKNDHLGVDVERKERWEEFFDNGWREWSRKRWAKMLWAQEHFKRDSPLEVKREEMEKPPEGVNTEDVDRRLRSLKVRGQLISWRKSEEERERIMRREYERKQAEGGDHDPPKGKGRDHDYRKGAEKGKGGNEESPKRPGNTQDDRGEKKRRTHEDNDEGYGAGAGNWNETNQSRWGKGNCSKGEIGRAHV